MNSQEHYQEFLKRIQTKENFRKEIVGKLEAVIDSGYPLPIEKKYLSELVAIMSLDTLGKPQFWPPL